MATLEQVHELLKDIEAKLAALPQGSRFPPSAINLTVLSDLVGNLGLVSAGEFRCGNSIEPGYGFDGMRIAYPPMTYGGSTWNLVGVDNDVLQVGISATDGKLYAGGGAVVHDANGINIYNDDALYNGIAAIKFLDTLGTLVTTLYSRSPKSADLFDLALTSRAGKDATLNLTAKSALGHQAQIYLGTQDTSKAASIDIKTNVADGATSAIDLVADAITLTGVLSATLPLHAATHVTGSTDVIASAVAGGNAGLMTGADKTKLDGIEAGAEVNNISDVNATDLTDGGNTTLHTHDALIADSLLTEQGDIIYASAASTPAALAHGTENQILTTLGHGTNPSWISFNPGEGIDITFSAGTVNIFCEDATSANKGVASFSTDNFSVSAGAVTIKDQGVALAELINATATDKLIGRSTAGSGAWEEIACTAAGRALLDDANAVAQLTTLGAVPLQPAADVIINDAHGDFNFTFEGDTDPYLLNLDAGADVISIGAAPQAKTRQYGKVQITETRDDGAQNYPALTLISNNTGGGLQILNTRGESTSLSGGVMGLISDFVPSTSGLRLGNFAWGAKYAAGSFINSGAIRTYSAETWQDDGSRIHAGSYMTFHVYPPGGVVYASAYVLEEMRLASDGLRIGNGLHIGALTTTATDDTVTVDADVRAGGGIYIGAINVDPAAYTLAFADNAASAIVAGTSSGLKIGTGTNQKIGFFNAAPVVQQAHIADPSGGAVVDTQCRSAVNSILAWLTTMGFTA